MTDEQPGSYVIRPGEGIEIKSDEETPILRLGMTHDEVRRVMGEPERGATEGAC